MVRKPKIGVVGACGTGKSELVTRLNEYGYQARHIAQEHSYTPKMWQLVTNPDFLIYLHVSYPLTLIRKKFRWSIKEYQEQLHRLQHAKDHANLIIDTDNQTPDEIFDLIVKILNESII